MTFNKQTASSTPIFSDLEFLKIGDICQFQRLSFVYDCQNKLAPAYFHNFVQCAQIHSFITRLTSRGDLFLEVKIHFNMVSDQLNTMELGFGIWFQFTSGNPLPLQFSEQISRNISFINIRIIPHCDHEFMGNSMRGHSYLLFLYQIRVAWWGLIELESLLPFFSSVNIKYKFDLLQRFLVISLS